MAATTLPKEDYAPAHVNRSPFYAAQLQRFALGASITLFATMLLVVYLLPLGNMALISLKDEERIVASARGPVLPVTPVRFTYQDEALDVFKLPMEDGTVREMALLQAGRRSSTFVDPANPEAEPIEWVGAWRSLEPVYELSPKWSNFPEAWEAINFPQLFFNTMFIAVMGIIGTELSCIAVAYAFARFPIPGKNILFIILIGTIILPGQVTLVPTYTFFSRIGWTGTWLPLIIPHFFANAYNVFLLRQFFMTLPRELDEAAMIDGANPFQILTKVIIPQAWPAIVTVALFHFVFAWNDYFGPLIYLIGQPDRQVISTGVQLFNYRYSARPELVQATSLMAMVLPLVLFFLAQRVFMRGVVITGVDK
jgi:multiple sugar transport system permease protein